MKKIPLIIAVVLLFYQLACAFFTTDMSMTMGTSGGISCGVGYEPLVDSASKIVYGSDGGMICVPE